jgi:hypothetical protein
MFNNLAQSVEIGVRWGCHEVALERFCHRETKTSRDVHKLLR